VLNLGRDSRTISRAQRRALNARDRGCVIPGCSAPPQWCEGHHVVWWRHGGRTDIDALALVCGRDHTLIHQGVWDLVMLDGVAWARPPTWIDPLRRLIRNTRHESADRAKALGSQLRLALEPPPLPPWMTPPAPAPECPQPSPGQKSPDRVEPDHPLSSSEEAAPPPVTDDGPSASESASEP
jgi:hypothetical protein